MLKDITLGQYYPAESPIHRLDPRTKLLLTILYIVLVMLVRTYWLFSALLALVVFMIAVSGVPAAYFLRTLKPLRWILVFTFIINLFFTGGDAIFKWQFIQITQQGLQTAVFMALRFIFLIMGTSMLTLATSPVALTGGLEKLLAPLAKLGFPAHELSMMMTIALRFIPTLMEETDKIQKAQMARGADFESGNFIVRAKSLVPLLIPLFVSAFRRAEDLAVAMEARCYHGGQGRTKMKILRFSLPDAVAALIMLCVSAAIIIFR